jgi:hypothetical protein
MSLPEDSLPSFPSLFLGMLLLMCPFTKFVILKWHSSFLGQSFSDSARKRGHLSEKKNRRARQKSFRTLFRLRSVSAAPPSPPSPSWGPLLLYCSSLGVQSHDDSWFYREYPPHLTRILLKSIIKISQSISLSSRYPEFYGELQFYSFSQKTQFGKNFFLFLIFINFILSFCFISIPPVLFTASIQMPVHLCIYRNYNCCVLIFVLFFVVIIVHFLFRKCVFNHNPR